MYTGLFSDWSDVTSNYRPVNTPEPKYVYANYEYECWEGYSTVVFSDDMETFGVVEGSHCSCYGLEDQWDPTFHSKEELTKMYGDRKEIMQWLETPTT